MGQTPSRLSEGGQTPSRVAYAAIICWSTYLHGIAEQQNIFQIFRWSFFHLRDGTDLYAPDPAHHNDLFKYSPTYALLFAPFALPPFPVGLFLWDALNVVLLYRAFGALLPHPQALLVRTLVVLEVYRSTIRSQSNTLLAALMILALVALERRRQGAAAASILLGTFVKLFPLGAAAFALFHPGRRASPASCSWGRSRCSRCRCSSPRPGGSWSSTAPGGTCWPATPPSVSPLPRC